MPGANRTARAIMQTDSGRNLLIVRTNIVLLLSWRAMAREGRRSARRKLPSMDGRRHRTPRPRPCEGAAVHRSFPALFLPGAPFLDLRVVAGEQHVGDLPADAFLRGKDVGAGVVRI